MDSEVRRQIDHDDDSPFRSGGFAPLSSDTYGDSSHVHACRIPTNAVDGGRAAMELAGPDAQHQGRVVNVAVSSRDRQASRDCG